MTTETGGELLADRYDLWVDLYKAGAVADVTLEKYRMTGVWLRELAKELTAHELDRPRYQGILNEYAKTHEKATTLDFHRQVRCFVKDLIHDGEIEKDPTYKAIVKGAMPTKKKKPKFLHEEELRRLSLSIQLDERPEPGSHDDGPNVDWLLLVLAKTGVRYAEALGLTPEDFDFRAKTVSINKTWHYKLKEITGFAKTKNLASVRTISIDGQLAESFGNRIANLPRSEPIFVRKNEAGGYIRVFNSTINAALAARCRHANVPVIAVHALRHTHASVLLSAGVSIHSISRRLGHSNVGTTQNVYAHILHGLNQKDSLLIADTLSTLTKVGATC